MSVNIDAGPKTALVVGATGAIGRALVRQLCEMRPDYGRVLAWTRRPLHYSHDKLFVEEEVDFDRMDKMPPERVQDIYCTLGTTLKQAGSEEEFLHVDVGYPRLLAKWGRSASCCFPRRGPMPSRAAFSCAPRAWPKTPCAARAFAATSSCARR